MRGEKLDARVEQAQSADSNNHRDDTAKIVA
jgi:hypothetical protein